MANAHHRSGQNGAVSFAPFEAAHAPREAARGDIVIVGAGLAGLFCALKLAPLPVTVISPARLGEGASSAWAQGGIAAAVGLGDTTQAHADDTVRAGAGLVDEAVARAITAAAPQAIRDLLSYGVPFDRDLAGHFVLSREAAHGTHRVVRVTGDRAGHAIMQALIAAVRAAPSIRVLEGVTATGLLTARNSVTGVNIARTGGDAGEAIPLPATAVVLATGGVGGLFEATTNPPYALGQGLAMAAAAGAVLADLEFVQFHPTALKVDETPNPLASEALRGEGALLRDAEGRRFMPDLHPDAELAPRDVVARAVYEADRAGGAFLDCRAIADDAFKARFSTFTASCHRHGLDPARDLIPITPAAHYHMGGIATDLRARSSVPGLWAIGEVASTGLHGANRLASNSLIEAAVMADAAAADLRGLYAGIEERAAARCDVEALLPVRAMAEPAVHSAAGTDALGVVRDEDGLGEALRRIARRRRATAAPDLSDGRHDVDLVAMMLVAARSRRHSIGAHYRRDFPGAPVHPARTFLTWQSVEAELDRIEPRVPSQAPAREHHPIEPIAALTAVCA